MSDFFLSRVWIIIWCEKLPESKLTRIELEFLARLQTAPGDVCELCVWRRWAKEITGVLTYGKALPEYQHVAIRVCFARFRRWHLQRLIPKLRLVAREISFEVCMLMCGVGSVGFISGLELWLGGLTNINQRVRALPNLMPFISFGLFSEKH